MAPNLYHLLPALCGARSLRSDHVSAERPSKSSARDESGQDNEVKDMVRVSHHRGSPSPVLSADALDTGPVPKLTPPMSAFASPAGLRSTTQPLPPAGALGPVGHVERLAAGQMSADALRAIVAHGRWTPARCVALGPVPDDLVLAWIAAGQVSREDYIASSVTHWQVHQPLPLVHAQHATTFKSPGQMLLHTPMPGASNSIVRQTYATRMLAAMALAKLGVRPTPTIAGLLPAEACCICGDGAVVTLDACAHSANMCAGCVAQWMACGASPNRCPSEGCRATLTPNDAIRVGAAPLIAQQLAAYLAQSLVAQQPHWRPCGTEDCVGGMEVPRKAAYIDFDCGVCGQHQQLIGAGAAGDLETIHRMVATYLGYLSGTRAMLPCHACGLPSVKISGCNAVNCPACRHHWKFEPKVPAAGSMVDLGLFEGLPAGVPVTRVDLANIVRKNCRRLELFKESL